MLRDCSGQASVAYNSIGKHLERSKLKTTSAEAKWPTLTYTALHALKKHDFALSKLHLNDRLLTKNVLK